MKTININPNWNSNYYNNTIYNIAYYIMHTKNVFHCTILFKCAHIGD